MSSAIETILQKLPPCFSDVELKTLLPGSDDRRYGLIKRATARGALIHLRRSLYCLSERHRRRPLNLFSIAQRIYGPSYVSFESALSYHGWIPEAVPATASASVNRSRTFVTPIGVFSFASIPARVFLALVDRYEEGGEVSFIARPWRAIADYVYANKKNWKGIGPLIESLRIDEEDLRDVTREELEALDEAFGKRRISVFVRGIRKDLGL